VKTFRCLAVISVLLPVYCFAEPFTIEQVLSAPFPDGLTSASHAPRVAWVFDNKGERNIWVADAPEFVPRQVTHYKGDDGQAIASVRLTPDGKTVVYARGSETNKEGTSANPQSLAKMPKQQVWGVNVSGGEPRLLGDVGCNEEGCEDLRVSPDASACHTRSDQPRRTRDRGGRGEPAAAPPATDRCRGFSPRARRPPPERKSSSP
jgi:hypothetical protein